MPGSKFPRGVHTFPTRDDLIEHLEEFAARHRLRVRTRTDVCEIERRGDAWRLITSRGPIDAQHVVLATGLFATPKFPNWPGQERYARRLLHSAEYRRPEPFVGERVLVVGAGTTGVEIAHELVAGGAESVTVAVRTPPNFVPRLVGKLPGLKAIVKAPSRFADAQIGVLQRLFIGDLSKYGLERPATGPFALMEARHVGPTIVGAHALNDIREGRIRIAASVESLDETGAVLVDGEHVEADSVIAATGFRSELPELVGPHDVLDEWGEPKDYDPKGPTAGLHFAGFENVPGQLAFCREISHRIAAEVGV